MSSIDIKELNPITPTENNQVLEIFRKIHNDEYSQKLLDLTISLAKKEEEVGIVSCEYPDISVDEMIKFSKRIKNQKTAEEKHKLLMEKTGSDALWYDVLMGDANKILFKPIISAIKKNYELSNIKPEKIADIGTGTGNTLRSVAPYCDSVFGVDLAGFSLRTAKKIGIPENAFLVEGKASELPFKKNSIDVVISNGLIFYLSPKETKQFVIECARILKQGGKFYISDIIKEDEEIVPKAFKTNTNSARNALLDLLGKFSQDGGHPDSIGAYDLFEILLQHNFTPTTIDIDDENLVLSEYTLK